MIQVRNSSILFVIALLLVSTANAQNFAMKAILASAEKTGFYAINVIPQLSSYTGIHFNDLRIADEKEQFLAYVIRTKAPAFYNNNYEKFSIIKNELQDSGKSTIIIENQKQENINSIALQIRNAAVSRTVNISGSDDLKKWYAIAEDIQLEKRFAADNDRYIQTISFPSSSYRYFKITIENGKNNPLNIIEAGKYVELQNKPVNVYLLNPPVNFIQQDSSDHNTYIRIHQTAPYHIDKITIKVNGPKFFKREAEVVLHNNNTSGFQISSDSLFSFYLPIFNDRDWHIKIYNGDNPPLHIMDVITEQEPKQIIVYLEKEKKYHLLMDDSLASKPVYDLQQFKDSISGDIPQLQILSFEKVAGKNQTAPKFISDKWLWPLIIVVLIVLGIFTVHLTKEVERKK